ncbi:MAG: LamG-like jellyroll fold domain-containing protein [Planctomycetota bacterium]
MKLLPSRQALTILAVCGLLLSCASPLAADPETSENLPPTSDNVGHGHHLHPHNPPHPTEPGGTRFFTSRDSKVNLPLPTEEDAFTFVVFGARTGGPADGVAILADAVRDVNLFEPDLVMTVGDLIDGYNDDDEWLVEMREYKAIMSELLCPWFPVAGNHDTYWRPGRDGDPNDRPENEHDDNYEMHFGPLWYAFEHKNSFFVVLYSDEGDPVTGTKSFGTPVNQIMSPEQKAWLGETLKKAKDADHVFVFLHHPRWMGGRYGTDWNNVHRMLVEAGNVTAVFAGHIHRMTYRGPRDGIEYVTLATVGGHNGQRVPEAGMLHHYNVVTVRKQQVAMTAIPVGAAVDPRAMTLELTTAAESLATLQLDFDRPLEVSADASQSAVAVSMTNPTTMPVELTLTPTTDDSRWTVRPEHAHVKLEGEASATVTFDVVRADDSLDNAFRVLTIDTDAELLTDSARYTIPRQQTLVPFTVAPGWQPGVTPGQTLAVDGEGGLMVASRDVRLPAESAFTLEGWIRGDDFAGRRGVLAKTERSEYGIFASDARPTFSVHLDGRYVTVRGEVDQLKVGRWHHVAGVFDGEEVRLYVDGTLVAVAPGSGRRTTNGLPLIIGGDVNRDGLHTSGFDGLIDDVRLTASAVYDGDKFEPPTRGEIRDDASLMSLNMDAVLGTFGWDEANKSLIGRATGDARWETPRDE